VGHGLMPISTVWEWIRDLPAVAPGEQHPDVPNHVVSAVTEINLRRLRATPPGGGRADWPAGALGWAGLANTSYWIDRKNGVGGYWATQILPFGDPTSFVG